MERELQEERMKDSSGDRDQDGARGVFEEAGIVEIVAHVRRILCVA